VFVFLQAQSVFCRPSERPVKAAYSGFSVGQSVREARRGVARCCVTGDSNGQGVTCLCAVDILYCNVSVIGNV